MNVYFREDLIHVIYFSTCLIVRGVDGTRLDTISYVIIIVFYKSL